MAVKPTSLNRHVGTLLLIASLGLIAIAKEVLVPLALATLLAVLLTPVVSWLVKRRVPNLLAVGLVVGTLTISSLLIGSMIFSQLNQVVDKLVEYRHNIHQRLSELASNDGTMSKATTTIHALQDELGHLGSDNAKDQRPAANEKAVAKKPPTQQVEVVSERQAGIGDLLPILSTALQPLAICGLTFLLATFMIVQRVDLQRRFSVLSAWMSSRGMSTIEGDSLNDITSRISSYLLLQSALNVTSGIIVTIGVHFLGLPNALLWGLLTALLRYVPYLGIVIAAGITTLFAIAVSPDWSCPVQVLLLFVTLELVMGNIVEPLVLAHGTGLSSLGVLVATAFWTWIWGPMGLFLAIPLTVCLVAVGRQVPSLAYLDILLAEKPSARDRSPTLVSDKAVSEEAVGDKLASPAPFVP